jgi:hypothetical protein
MKRLFVTVIIVVIVAVPLISKYRTSSKGEKKLQSETPIFEQIATPLISKKPRPDEKKFRTLKSSPINRASSASPYAKKPEGNIIDFKVVDGLAVAYGDIVLGRLETGAQLDHGQFEAPNPQLWERPDIPYLINPDLPNPTRVVKALEYFRQNTPIRFIPYENQRDALVFEPGTEHCLSSLGRTGGLQPIKLAAGCRSQEVLHEIMHALGFVHEQSRPDRDKYLEILWQNIDEKYQSQFGIVPDSFLEAERGSGFDYHSIMLYPANTFSTKPELSSLRSVSSEQISPVQEGLSAEDVKRINRLFNLYE